MGASPALSAISNVSDFTDEELDQYFASYVPLSSLPTPPPAKPVPSTGIVESSTEDIGATTPELQAHAIHLSKLIPSNLSTQPPSTPIISDFLVRARLPVEILAFTACLLDALSQRFATSWRAANLPPTTMPFKYVPVMNHFRQSPPIRSEVVVLAALSLAHGWLEDRPRSNSHWASIGGASQFTSQEVDVARTCILRDIDYGLFRITGEMVGCMVEEMQRAANQNTKNERNVDVMGREDGATEKEKEEGLKLSPDWQGAAMWVHGIATPETSP